MQRPEPAQIRGTSPSLIDATDAPLAAEHAVIDVVLVDAMAKSGRAEFEGHRITAVGLLPGGAADLHAPTPARGLDSRSSLRRPGSE